MMDTALSVTSVVRWFLVHEIILSLNMSVKMSLSEDKKREWDAATAEAIGEKMGDWVAENCATEIEREKLYAKIFLDGIQWCATRLMIEKETG